VEGRHAGTRWHQSLRTNDERTAIRLVNRIIETGRLEFDEPRPAGVTVLQAIEAFLAEQTSRGMAGSTLRSFRKFLIGSPTCQLCGANSSDYRHMLRWMLKNRETPTVSCSTSSKIVDSNAC
jgi:hypothetical protein